MPNEVLYTAIAALASAVLTLWRLRERDAERWRKDQKDWQKDKKDASRLIFALLGRVYELRKEKPPPTESQWEDEPSTAVTNMNLEEAKRLAVSELNGDVETLVKDYLRSNPPDSDGSEG